MRSLRLKTVLRRSLWMLRLRKRPQWPISSVNWEAVFKSYHDVNAYENIRMGVDPTQFSDTSTYSIITTIEARRRYEEAALKRIKEELDGLPTDLKQ